MKNGKPRKRKMTIEKLLTKLGATVSISEGRRVVVQGAVRLNGMLVTNMNVDFDFYVGDVIEVGKRSFTVEEKDLEEVLAA